MAWSHHHPVHITFGRGARGALPDRLPRGRRLFVCSPRGRRQLTEDPDLGGLTADTNTLWCDDIGSHPSLSQLENAARALHETRFEAVIAFGGGSVIDSAKVLNLALATGRRVRDLLTGSAPSAQQTPPLFALPTTAGTGSEVTPFATVWDRAARRKRSMEAVAAYPTVAIVDPSLTDSLPAASTRDTGLDAINQALESVWNWNATPLTQALASRALRAGLEALPRLLRQPTDTRARDQLAECSLLAGICISQTRTALCHSISYPLTAHYGVPHGLACAFTAPSVLQFCLPADDGRLAELAQALTGADTAALQERLRKLNAEMGVSEAVRASVPSWSDLLALEDQMLAPGRADNTLRTPSGPELRELLHQAWAEES